MARTTKVGLDVDEKPFVQGMGRAEKAAEGLEDALDDVAGSAKDTTAATGRAKDSVDDLGDSAKDAGKDLSRLRGDAEKLDQQIDDATRSIRDLAREIAAASDEAERAKLVEKLRLEQLSQRDRISLRKLIDIDSAPEVGAEMAEGVSLSFVQRLGPLMASAPLSPAGAALGVTLGAAAAPTLAAAVSGAVLGGVGVGGVLGGVALAARDPQVKAAGASLGAFMLGDLEARAAGFVPPVLEGIRDIRAGWQAVGPDLDRVFESSRFVDPLVQGAISGGRKLVAGLADVMDEADLPVDAVARMFDTLGQTAGRALSTMAQDADEGAAAIDDLTLSVGRFIDTSAKIVHAAATMRGWTEELDTAIDKGRYWVEDSSYLSGALERVGINLDITADGFAKGSAEAEAYRKATLGTAEATDFATLKTAGMTDAEIAGADASGRYRQQLDETADGTRDVGNAANTAAVEVETLSEMIRRMAGENLTAEQASLRLEEAIDRATEAGRKNNDGIDRGTAKGRENRQALIGIAEAANASADAIRTQTGSQELASAATDRGRVKFFEAARAMGASKAEAKLLADQLFAIPAGRVVTVSTPGMGSALENARLLKQRIDSIDRRIDITAKMTTSYAGPAHSGQGYSTGMRWGGVVEHAQDGLLNLRQAGVYAPVGPARYAFAEPATGGEAFIPRFGNPDRSLDILSKAARWYGHAVVPAGGVAGAGSATSASGGGGTVNVNLSAYSNQFSLSQVMQDLAMRGAH